MAQHKLVADQLNVKVTKLDRGLAKTKFPYLDFKDCDEAVKQSIPKFGSPMSTNHFLDLL